MGAGSSHNAATIQAVSKATRPGTGWNTPQENPFIKTGSTQSTPQPVIKMAVHPFDYLHNSPPTPIKPPAPVSPYVPLYNVGGPKSQSKIDYSLPPGQNVPGAKTTLGQ